MQSGYGGAGGVSEIQQFMVDGCSPSLFSISTAANASPDLQAAPPHHHKFLPHPPPPPPPATHFSHFHSNPITQHFFHPQFHLFHRPQDHHETQQQQRRLQLQRLGLDQDSGPENSGSPTPMMGGGRSAGAGGGASGSAFLTAAKNFKLAVNENSSRGGLNDDSGGILQGDDVSDTRVHPWQREEESSIKEPFWRPLDIDYTNRANKRCKEKQPEMPSNYCKKIKGGGEHDQGNSSGSNYKLFSELEAICKPGGGGGGFNATNQTGSGSGSGSGLTGENPLAAPVAPGPTSEQHVSTVNHGSETSTGDQEEPVKKPQKSSKRKRWRRHQLSSIAAFFEGLLKQLMQHQEGLHCKFLEVMERREQERSSREEAWRKQEAAKSSREATARAQERALVTTRETAIISFLEKINGESLNLPARPQLQSQLPDESQKEDNTDDKNSIEPPEAFNIDSNRNGNGNTNPIQLNTGRWPKAEVQALIRVRSSLESRFQEPGLKGPLWEEVSSMMASMGYNRSAKRCKEKWENINKYFRKTKDSGKKRPQHSKTCPYFLQLDQFYSKSFNKSPPPPSTATSAATTTADPPTAVMEERRDSSELLDAIVVSNDNPSIKFTEMSSLSFDFNGNGDRDNEASGSMIAGKGLMELDRQPVAGSLEDNNHEDDKDEDEEEV